jgi:formyl-CoA transferase
MALADFITGVHLGMAVLIALRQQKRGEYGGQLIDISLYEPLFNLLGADFLTSQLTGEIPQPTGNELSYVVPRNNYRTKDDRWVTMSGAAQKPFERLMELVGHPEMNSDPRFKTNEERIKDPNRRIINQVIAEWVGSRNLQEVVDTCERLGITIGPIANMQDIVDNEHYRARDSILKIKDPVTGTVLQIPNISFRLLGTPGRIRFPGLPLGSANEAIYGDLLGYDNTAIDKFKRNGVI